MVKTDSPKAILFMSALCLSMLLLIRFQLQRSIFACGMKR